MLNHVLHPVGSTGNSQKYIAQTSSFSKAMVEFEIESVGATPTVTFTVQGLIPGTDATVAANWVALALLQADSTVAASNAAIVVTSVGKTRRYVDGLDKRAFDAFAITTSANTNVTYSSRLYVGF